MKKMAIGYVTTSLPASGNIRAVLDGDPSAQRRAERIKTWCTDHNRRLGRLLLEPEASSPRPALHRALAKMESGMVLVVSSLADLGPDASAILAAFASLDTAGGSLVTLDEGINTLDGRDTASAQALRVLADRLATPSAGPSHMQVERAPAASKLADAVAEPAEPASKSAEPASKSAEPAPKSAEPAPKSAEPAPKSAEPVAKGATKKATRKRTPDAGGKRAQPTAPSHRADTAPTLDADTDRLRDQSDVAPEADNWQRPGVRYAPRADAPQIALVPTHPGATERPLHPPTTPPRAPARVRRPNPSAAYGKTLERAAKQTGKGNLKKAAAVWSKFLPDATGESAALVHNQLGDLYLRMRNHELAEGHFMEAAERFERHGFPDRAVAALRKVMRLHPERGDVHFRMAGLYAKRDHHRDAIDSYFAYIHYLKDAGREVESGPAFQRMRVLDPLNGTHRVYLSNTMFDIGLLQEGGDEAIAAAQVLLADGDRDGATRHLTDALERVPERDDLARFLAELTDGEDVADGSDGDAVHAPVAVAADTTDGTVEPYLTPDRGTLDRTRDWVGDAEWDEGT